MIGNKLKKAAYTIGGYAGIAALLAMATPAYSQAVEEMPSAADSAGVGGGSRRNAIGGRQRRREQQQQQRQCR